MSTWFCNGQAIDAISTDDRAAQYGDGLFETIAIRDGSPRFWSAHIARLQLGCSRLGIACPSDDSLRADLESALRLTSVSAEYATAKLLVSAGTGPRGYQRLADSPAIARIGVFAAGALPAAQYREGVATRLCATRLATQPQLAGIKSLNRLEQVLARSEWSDPGIFEGLMLDTDKRLICGTMSNVFIATQSFLATPAITRCGISGIMRSHVLRLLQDAGIDCVVRDVQVGELASADEVFLTNSQFGILPLRQCADLQWSVGAITQQAQKLAAANGVPECVA